MKLFEARSTFRRLGPHSVRKITSYYFLGIRVWRKVENFLVGWTP